MSFVELMQHVKDTSPSINGMSSGAREELPQKL